MVRQKTKGRSLGSSSRSSSASNRGPRSEISNRTEVIVEGRRIRKVRVLQEIKYLRSNTKLLISKAPFVRLVREILIDIFPRLDIRRMQVLALEALQESAEMYIVQYFEDAILLAYHARRITLMQRDMVMLRRLRGRDDVINR